MLFGEENLHQRVGYNCYNYKPLQIRFVNGVISLEVSDLTCWALSMNGRYFVHLNAFKCIRGLKVQILPRELDNQLLEISSIC